MRRIKVIIRTCIDPYHARKNKSKERVGTNDFYKLLNLYYEFIRNEKAHIRHTSSRLVRCLNV